MKNKKKKYSMMSLHELIKVAKENDIVVPRKPASLSGYAHDPSQSEMRAKIIEELIKLKDRKQPVIANRIAVGSLVVSILALTFSVLSLIHEG